MLGRRGVDVKLYKKEFTRKKEPVLFFMNKKGIYLHKIHPITTFYNKNK